MSFEGRLERLEVVFLRKPNPNTPNATAIWDCHRTAAQARGGGFGGSMGRQSYGSLIRRVWDSV